MSKKRDLAGFYKIVLYLMLLVVFIHSVSAAYTAIGVQADGTITRGISVPCSSDNECAPCTLCVGGECRWACARNMYCDIASGEDRGPSRREGKCVTTTPSGDIIHLLGGVMNRPEHAVMHGQDGDQDTFGAGMKLIGNGDVAMGLYIHASNGTLIYGVVDDTPVNHDLSLEYPYTGASLLGSVIGAGEGWLFVDAVVAVDGALDISGFIGGQTANIDSFIDTKPWRYINYDEHIGTVNFCIEAGHTWRTGTDVDGLDVCPSDTPGVCEDASPTSCVGDWVAMCSGIATNCLRWCNTPGGGTCVGDDDENLNREDWCGEFGGDYLNDAGEDKCCGDTPGMVAGCGDTDTTGVYVCHKEGDDWTWSAADAPDKGGYTMDLDASCGGTGLFVSDGSAWRPCTDLQTPLEITGSSYTHDYICDGTSIYECCGVSTFACDSSGSDAVQRISEPGPTPVAPGATDYYCAKIGRWMTLDEGSDVDENICEERNGAGYWTGSQCCDDYPSPQTYSDPDLTNPNACWDGSVLNDGITASGTGGKVKNAGGQLYGCEFMDPEDIPSANLVGYWSFDGNADDSSGNDNLGVAYNEAALADGIIGQAYQFDGINDYIELPPTVNPTTAITVSAWVKSDTLGYKGLWQIVSKYDAFILGTSEADSDRMCFLIHDGSDWKPDNYGTVGCYDVPNPEAWHHFAGTYDSSTEKIRLYVDGVLRSERDAEDTINLDAGPIHIGHRESDSIGTNHFQGKIDEVRIYDAALTESEIADLAMADVYYCETDAADTFYCSRTDEVWEDIGGWSSQSEDKPIPLPNVPPLEVKDWLDGTLVEPSGCCHPSQCWHGGSEMCINNQIDCQPGDDDCYPDSHPYDDGTGEKDYRCVIGKWKEASLAYDWQPAKLNHMNHMGYCPGKELCLYNKEEDPYIVGSFYGYGGPDFAGACVNVSTYDEYDNYCEVVDGKGKWTTRTKLVAQGLLDLAEDAAYGCSDYTFYCGKYIGTCGDESGVCCNDPAVVCKVDGGMYTPKNILPPIYSGHFDYFFLDEGDTWLPDSEATIDYFGYQYSDVYYSNNYCVLSCYDKDLTIFGTSLNRNADGGLRFIEVFGKDPATCNIDLSYYTIGCADKCDVCGDDEVWFDNETAIVFYRKGGLSSGGADSLFSGDPASFNNVLGDYIDAGRTKLFNVISASPADLEAGVKDYPDYSSASADFTRRFDQLYLRKKGSKYVRGILEEAAFAKPYFLINYEGLNMIDQQGSGIDICDYLVTGYDDVVNIEGNALFHCFTDDQGNNWIAGGTVVNYNTYQTHHGVYPTEVYYYPYEVFDFYDTGAGGVWPVIDIWADLTAKLRVE
ncbi:LamG domain-containing protein [Candidatus Woesearchaeota archaeon]|nr:LamG domain-containing protein [Candidatus Woesearchaeota archaeon]